MGIIEEEKQTTPPPRGWSPAQKKNAHGVEKIVYDRSFLTTHHTKGRHREQEKVYHKTRSGATPDGQTARNAWHGMERLREQLDHNIDAQVRPDPLDPVLNVAARTEARSDRAYPAAREQMDISGIRHRHGKGLHKRGQGQHGRSYEAHGRHGHTLQTCRAEAQTLPIRCEDDDRRGHAGQGCSMPENVLQPHRGRRPGRVPRPDAIPSRPTTKTAATGARGEDCSWQEATKGQTEGGLGGEGARTLGDGHSNIKERLKRRAPCNA